MKRDKYRYSGDDPNAFKEIEEDPIKVDFTGCASVHDIHMTLKCGLGLPDYYGENWDALWDLISDYCDYPIDIELHGVHTVSEKFDEDIAMMIDVFNDVMDRNPHIRFIVIS